MGPGAGDIFLTSRTGESDRTEKSLILPMQMLLRMRRTQAWQISHSTVSPRCETSFQIWPWTSFFIKAGIANTFPTLSYGSAIESSNYIGNKTLRSRAQSVSSVIPWEVQSSSIFCATSKAAQSRTAARVENPKQVTSQRPKTPRQMRSDLNARSFFALGPLLHSFKCSRGKQLAGLPPWILDIAEIP